MYKEMKDIIVLIICPVILGIMGLILYKKEVDRMDDIEFEDEDEDEEIES